MKEFDTLEEACRAPGIVRVEATNPPRGYTAEDLIPVHMQSDEERVKSGEKPMKHCVLCAHPLDHDGDGRKGGSLPKAKRKP